jgi:PhzF family phenazine biosynthesis protein
MKTESLHKLAAFTDTPDGGNPAGVWVGEELPDRATMQRIATEVGFSETAFVTPTSGERRSVRYFSPEAEVSFCGHATIATGVVLGESGGEGRYILDTTVGEIPVVVSLQNGALIAALTSVEPTHRLAPDGLIEQALATLDWRREDLDLSLAPAMAYAGAWHLVLAASSAERLADLDYDFDGLKALMQGEDLTTLQLVWRERVDLFHCRNPFPVGGVVEDPATGAAAAALGGYLRDAGLIEVPASVTIRQGEAMGRPSGLHVEIPAHGGIVVSGRAVRI